MPQPTPPDRLHPDGPHLDRPYREPALPVEQRVEDLLTRMGLEDKAGLMFHDMQLIGPAGALMGTPNMIGRRRRRRRRRWLRCRGCG